MKIVFKQKKLKGKGAIVGRLTIIGEAKIEGRDLSSLSIGEQSSIGRSEITLHNKVNIGKNVVINDGVILLTATHRLTDPKWTLKSAPITVNDYAWIATNAIILPGVTIGKGAVVGAGAVVREDVPDYAIVFGNPAEIVEGRQRTNNLDYSPVLFNAPYEAWIGKNLDE
jgi:acetyltransferase-like isoleucine patch superfamily enzyme